jgi:hypothetical protein
MAGMVNPKPLGRTWIYEKGGIVATTAAVTRRWPRLPLTDTVVKLDAMN